MLSKYQLKIAYFHNIPIGAVKRLVFNFLDKEKKCSSLSKHATLFHTKIKPENIYSILEFNQPQWLKPYVEFKAQKNRSRKKL